MRAQRSGLVGAPFGEGLMPVLHSSRSPHVSVRQVFVLVALL